MALFRNKLIVKTEKNRQLRQIGFGNKFAKPLRGAEKGK